MARPKKQEAAVEEFNREAFSPEDGKHYRIHFKNGYSGEYSGQALASGAPFPWGEVVSAQEIASVVLEKSE